MFSQLSLTCCLCGSEPNRAQFVAAGAVQLVLEALRTCPDDHGVQASACGALANLAQNGTHGTRSFELLSRSPGTVHTDDARAIVVVKGGIPLIVAALSKFPTRHRVVQRACWALLSLTARNGTVHSVVEVTYHCGSHTVLVFARTADSICVQIAIDGGIAAIVQGMRGCADSPDAQQYGAWALANIAWSEGTC